MSQGGQDPVVFRIIRIEVPALIAPGAGLKRLGKAVKELGLPLQAQFFVEAGRGFGEEEYEIVTGDLLPPDDLP